MLSQAGGTGPEVVQLEEVARVLEPTLKFCYASLAPDIERWGVTGALELGECGYKYGIGWAKRDVRKWIREW